MRPTRVWDRWSFPLPVGAMISGWRNKHNECPSPAKRTLSGAPHPGTESSLDSPLEGDGFELVWGFPCQTVFFGLLPVLCSEREGPFFIPSPTIRFPERAQWGQGIESLAKLGALRPSGACVWQRLDA